MKSLLFFCTSIYLMLSLSCDISLAATLESGRRPSMEQKADDRPQEAPPRGDDAYADQGVDYDVIVDDHDTPLPTETQHCNYYNYTGGNRGVLNAEDVAYSWDGNSAYTATVTHDPGTWTWGGMSYSLIRIDGDNIPLDFRAIFGPYVKSEHQGQITQVKLAVDDVASPSDNTGLELRIELKNEDGVRVGSRSWTDLTSLSYPTVFTWTVPDDLNEPVELVLWVLDRAKEGDSIAVDSIGLTATAPGPMSGPTEDQAFLWTYSWLMANYNASTGMVDDRSNFDSASFENVSATGKTAKIVYYAYKKGFTTREDAEHIITKIADTLISKVPRGPAGKNTVWPHFTRNGGQEALPPSAGGGGTEWASGDTAYTALDIIAALQMFGDPQGQIPFVEQFLREIDWQALLTEDGGISHGYAYEGNLLDGSWLGFGMETIGVNWAYASATGNVAVMGPPPSDNGSGFIDNAHYPVVLSGIDRWGNDWSAYRDMMAETQIEWYTAERNPYLSEAGLFGLSAGECPEAYLCVSDSYRPYGVGGRLDPAQDGGGEVIVLHYSAMIADIRLAEATHMWEVLRDRGAAFLEDEVVISPLNNMESMRVDKATGKCTINHLKGSWNLALQAEGWALADPDVRDDLGAAVQSNDFLRTGHELLTLEALLDADFLASLTTGVAPLQIAFSDQSLGVPTAWSWDFGDGTTSAEPSPSHEYSDPGYYTVTLTVSDGFSVDSECKENHIWVTFPDVLLLPLQWAAYQVIACSTDNIVQGFPDGYYRPEVEVTRGQMAVYVSRALVRPAGDDAIPDPYPPPTFTDVSFEHWAHKHIEYAASQDVVQGYPDGTYVPELVVDRGQMAVYIARAIVAPMGDAAIPDPTPPFQFTDVPGADNAYAWCHKHVAFLGDRDVVAGYPDSRYHPEYAVTRDQMAVYIQRAFDLWIPD